MSSRKCGIVCLLLAFCLLSSALSPAAAESSGDASALTVSLPETVKGYTPCQISILSPAAGEAVLSLYDALNNPWLTRRESLLAGENLLPWDGLGTHGERLMAGPYHFDVSLKAEDGREFSGSASFKINATTPTLVYALPSSDTLYLDHGERWFVEIYVSAECLVAMEVLDSSGAVVFSRDTNVKDADGTVIRWSGAVNEQKKVFPGEYTVHMWGKLNPSYDFTFPLTVAESAPPEPEITATGPILPERGMSDEEIWEIMMKPSVVIAGNGSFLRFNLYQTPNTGSWTAGSLRCATQGLEIIHNDGTWCLVHAWSHTDGHEATGYIQTKKLITYSPNGHYGVLIDKREQTLTVYEDGKPIGTVPVSTGLPTKGNAYRETPAGAFLTDVHIGASFAQDGYRYDYPLRYDAGNIIHSTGFKRTGRVRDYSQNLALLGQKASHGCVRVSPFLTGDSPINMYWLWIHLPYHTRVLILDD
jgi:flagellar hook assembly protein FlgD